MALRSPIYLDTETLLAQAEYHDIDVPRQMDVVEKTVQRRGGGGKIALSGIGFDATGATDAEYQSTYSLQPKEKATVSKVIDALIRSRAIVTDLSDETVLSKDDLIEIEGNTQITSATLVGKIFFILRRLMDRIEGDPSEIFNLKAEDLPVAEQLKEVYLRNELLPIPILLSISGSGLSPKVYINVRPDHFIDSATANRVEGDLRILGTVSHIIGDDGDGYLSTEQWLMHDWEYLLRRKMMTQVQDFVRPLIRQLEIGPAPEDVQAYIKGPAIIIDAIALY
ncbi:hypothetical protein LFT48_21995 (plasmid) [Arthrobacter sp. FW305-123]|nr:hypothetical protein LFT48_21995 [Arthrobacter sp. FW305-123]